MQSDEKFMMDKIQKELLDELEYMGDLSDEKIEELIAEKLLKESKEVYIPLELRIRLGKKLYYAMRRLDILQELLDDESITEIMVNGTDHIFIEKAGRIEKLDRKFESKEKLENIIQQIVAKCNRVVNDSSPIVDARLLDGSRVNVVLNPVALNGPILTIRRFPKEAVSMEKLISIGSVTKEAAELLEKLVIAGYNIIISGGTGSGKTTFLNALSGFVNKEERIITIEDSAELQLQGIDNLVRMETKNANTQSCKPITIRDLIKTSLRMRPTRIIVGEVRGGEAMDMICSAMNCGHDGSMSTIHANSAQDALARLEIMILMAVEMPITAIRNQVGNGVDIIIQLGRMRDKSRKVLEITEILQYSQGEILTKPLYIFQEETGNETEKLQGKLVKVGELEHVQKLKAAGIRI